MNSILKDEKAWFYQEKLQQVVPDEHRKKVNEEMLVNLDNAVAVLAVEREFMQMYKMISLQQGWLRSTSTLATSLLMLCNFDTRKVARQVVNDLSSETSELLGKIISLDDKLAHVSSILKELRKEKERYLNDVYWDIFRNEDHHSPAVDGIMTNQLSVESAQIPGTLAHELVEARQRICMMWPELNDTEQEAKFTEYRLDFVLGKKPDQMDEFTGEMIQSVMKVLNDESAERLYGQTKQHLMAVVETAQQTPFSVEQQKQE